MTTNSGNVRVELIRSRLQDALSPEVLEITDDSHMHVGHAGAQGGAGHYSVHIVASAFVNQNTVARHRLIYDALNDLMPDQIHALSIKAEIPENN
jgi:BolA protein